MARPPVDVFIGLGSNLNRPVIQLKRAINHLKNKTGVGLQDCSSLYLSEPVGYANQPPFVNAVVKFTTRLSCHALLMMLQSLERKHHRLKTLNRNGPRTLDLDILLYGTIVCETDKLIIPHPRMHERRFVLEPLVEISPKVVIPGRGFATVFLDCVSDQNCRRLTRFDQLILLD